MAATCAHGVSMLILGETEAEIAIDTAYAAVTRTSTHKQTHKSILCVISDRCEQSWGGINTNGKHRNVLRTQGGDAVRAHALVDCGMIRCKLNKVCFGSG